MDYPKIINESCSISQISNKELRNILRNIKKARLIPCRGNVVFEYDGNVVFERKYHVEFVK